MAKGSVRKKGKSGTIAFISKMKAETVCRRSSPEQKASQKRKHCSKGNGGLRGKEIRCQNGECYGGNAFRSMGGRRIETRQSE